MKTSSINLVPFLQLVLPVMDGVNLLVEEVRDKFSQIISEIRVSRRARSRSANSS